MKMSKNSNIHEGITEDAHMWRIVKKRDDRGFREDNFEVLAVYYKEENGFLVFKDSTHKPVYTVTAGVVEDIIRLRTDTILAVSQQFQADIIEALAEYAMRLELEQESCIRDNKGTKFAVSDKSIKWTKEKVARLQEASAYLRRGEGIAARRREDDPYSLPEWMSPDD